MWTRKVVVDEKHNLSVHAVEWSRRGPPCVLLHGFGDNASVWSLVAPRLMARFRVIAVDLRGHGDSDWDPEARYDAETFAGDLARVVAAFGLGRTILIGHSWGAAIAIRFAAARPDQVAALVIADFGPELVQAGVDEVLKGFVETPRSFASPDEYTKWLAARRPLADSRLLLQYARRSLRQSGDGRYEVKNDAAIGTQSELNRLAAEQGRYRLPDLWDALAGIKCRTLVLRGAASGVFPRDVAARMVEQTLADSELHTIGAAGHAVMMDNPLQFVSRIEEFLISAARD